jgi:sirohydrochlorin cobaltochelatase
MPPQTATLLIPGDIGNAWGLQQAESLVRGLEQRLNQPVTLCVLDDSAGTFTAELNSLMDAGIRRLVVMPLGVLPLSHWTVVPPSFAWARQKWPFLGIHVAAPITWLEWSGWLRVTVLDALDALAVRPEEAAVLIVGHDWRNPLMNADIARLAHLVQEGIPLAWARHAFLGTMRPNLVEAVLALARTSVRSLVVVPWLVTADESVQRLEQELQAARELDMNATIRMPDLAHSALINVLVSNHFAALADDAWASSVDSGRIADDAGQTATVAGAPQTQITPDEALGLRELERRINALLPPEYQGRYEDVSPRSMGTADLKIGSDGKVAWDEIWTSFCDLALSGGPPHRGTLLEAVTPTEALAEPDKYQEVVAEIERGIRLVTALPLVASRTPGWVGVHCENEEMAIWLMRAIIVENIMVRREADVVYLPAGPKFTLKREIKNVITALAKTVHYWTAHLVARRRD